MFWKRKTTLPPNYLYHPFMKIFQNITKAKTNIRGEYVYIIQINGNTVSSIFLKNVRKIYANITLIKFCIYQEVCNTIRNGNIIFFGLLSDEVSDVKTEHYISIYRKTLCVNVRRVSCSFLYLFLHIHRHGT